MPDPRIVVTGAAGFIGSRLLEALTATHSAADLLAVDHPVPVEKQANLGIAPHVPFLDQREFILALELRKMKPELIFHMGACSSTTEWPVRLA